MSTEEKQMSRREALALMGTSAAGFAVVGSAMATEDSIDTKLRATLPKFTIASRALLRQVIDDPTFRGAISPKDTALLTKNESLTTDELMLALLPFAQSYARPPISNFFVGVVVRGASGTLYLGSNIEIPGQCLGFAVHGEQSASIEGVHEFGGVCSSARRSWGCALRTLPPVHGGNVSGRRDCAARAR